MSKDKQKIHDGLCDGVQRQSFPGSQAELVEQLVEEYLPHPALNKTSRVDVTRGGIGAFPA